MSDVAKVIIDRQIVRSDAASLPETSLVGGFDALRETIVAALDPSVTIVRMVNHRISALTDAQAKGLDDIMAAPDLSEPTYKALAEISHDWLLPGIDTLPADTTTLVESNRTFISAFLVGMNHELARELLWREYPTDQRGTYSRQFWAHRNTGNPTDQYDLKHLLHASPELTLEQLGEKPDDVASPLVLVVKGDLVRRYPGMLVTAAKTKKSGSIRTLDPATEIQPDFVARLEPDVLLVGFETLSADEVWALGDDEDTAWWFFFAEHFTEPRFGLDQPAAGDPATFADWNDASWGNAVLDAAGRLGADSFNVPPLPKSKPGTAPGPKLRLARQQLVDRVDPVAVPVSPRHARHGSPAPEAGVMSGIDPQIPITMLPVRIETRFAGTPASPRLQVRLYPDDVHVDHHDPRLTSREVAAGKRYWTSVRAGTAGDQAWAQLLKDVGPTRAIWARQALTPTNASGAPTFPDAATVDGNAGIAATARALPGSFIVRVRYAGGQKIVQGSAIPASLQVGISFGTAPPGTTPAPPPSETTRRSFSTNACAGWSISTRRWPSAWPSRSICRRRRISCRT